MPSTCHTDLEVIYKRVQSIHLLHLITLDPKKGLLGEGRHEKLGHLLYLRIAKYLNESRRHLTLNEKLPNAPENTWMADPIKPSYLISKVGAEMDQQPALRIWVLTQGCWASLPGSFLHMSKVSQGALDCVCGSAYLGSERAGPRVELIPGGREGM